MKDLTVTGAICLAGVLTAAPAFANCPTGADMGRGIAVTFDTGDVTTSQRRNDGSMEIIERSVDGNMFRFIAHRGLYHSQEISLDTAGRPIPDSLIDIRFPVEPRLMPEPVPGERWQGTTVTDSADGITVEEMTSYVFGARDPLLIGECSYDAVSVDVRYDWGDDGGMNLIFAYLPALGTTVLLTSKFDDDPSFTSVPVQITLKSK